MSIDHHTLCKNYLANSWHALPSPTMVVVPTRNPKQPLRLFTESELRQRMGSLDADSVAKEIVMSNWTEPKPWDWPWDWWGLWKSWYVMGQLRVGKQCVDLGLDPEARTLLHFLIVYAQHPSYWTLAWRSWLGLNRFFTFIFRLMPFWNVLAWNSTCLLVTYIISIQYVKSCKYTQIL